MIDITLQNFEAELLAAKEDGMEYITRSSLLDRPAQVVAVPAMLLLVPGSMGFRGMASLLRT